MSDIVKHGNLAAALAAVQAQIPPVSKGNTAQVASAKGSYSYTYADLAEITPLILPLLGRNGLAFSARPTMVGDAFVLHYVLAHESGETLDGLYPLPDPTSARPQEIGSAITYARRYALCAVTGIAPGGDDDDAAAANERPQTSRKPRQPKPVVPEPATQGWAERIGDAGTVDELRAVYDAVEAKAELGRVFAASDRGLVVKTAESWGLPVPPESVTVGQFLKAVKQAMESPQEPDMGPLPGLDAPTGGDES